METIFSLDNTIFAWATGLDRAARGILRVSGSDTFSVLAKIFISDDKNVLDGHLRGEIFFNQAMAGWLTISRGLKVRCWVWIFHGPRSFTGQDMIEIHTVSSLPLLRMIDQRLLELGLETARAGEFSARAFLLGKMDLTQAQAVKELVDAQNDVQIQAALSSLGGKLHQWIMDVYRELSELAAAVETNIDFSEEEIEVITLEQLVEKLGLLCQTISDVLRRAIDTQAIRALPQVFLAGPVNAGKSTLLNRLTGLDRAICSPLPGTTRDILTAVWQYEQREVLLCDTPGLLEGGADEITQSAIERVKQFIQLADLVIFVFDAGQGIEGQMRLVEQLPVNQNKAMAVLNKTDMVVEGKLESRMTELKGYDIFPVSALTGKGMDDLTREVFLRLSDIALTTAGHQIVLDLRGREILESALVCIKQGQDDARSLLAKENILGLETIAVSVQHALRMVGTLLGKDVTEDVLDSIFSRFCIGK
ncbi:MAG: tRNA uridine-5-carboxymethylaminomethyl(34) synthesis GTPase MnmE [Phycisphaerae bacterium]